MTYSCIRRVKNNENYSLGFVLKALLDLIKYLHNFAGVVVGSLWRDLGLALKIIFVDFVLG